MGLTAFIVERKIVAYFFVFLFCVGGIFGFLSLGQLEDPIFSIKKAVIVTPYPGASPQQVELEVTDRIEKAIQELEELDYIYSWSHPGLSVIKVEMRQEFWSDRLPQIWLNMRKKINDITPLFPPGVGTPDVWDDFNFVYGFLVAITGDGFSYAELEEFADDVKKELSVVDGVARAEIWGVQNKVVYLDTNETQLAELGLTRADFEQTLQIQNKVIDAGAIDVSPNRLRIEPLGEFKTPEEIGELAIRSSTADTGAGLIAPLIASGGGTYVPNRTALVAGTRPRDSGTRADSSELLRIKDVATVRPGYLEPPYTMMRFDGKPALAVYVASVEGGNVVDTGDNLDKRMQELMAGLPVGIELHKIAWQSDLVSESVIGFLISLAMAVGIVLVVLIVPSGLRMGLIIGSMLIFIILGTFMFMSVVGVDLQRMSLGALIIAMGMMVDNSCFVSDAMWVRMQRGVDRVTAAVESGSTQSWALLGATIIAVMAFYPIFASQADAGEYCRSLFIVVAISLMLSWLISMTLTPVMCIDVLPDPKGGGAAADPFDTPFFRGLRKFATLAIRHRFVTIAIMSAVLVSAFAAYPDVRQMFFPKSTRPQIMVDYWAPEMTRIQDTAAGIEPIEEWLMNHPRVDSVSSFVGQGPPRFYLPVDAELINPAYAELIVNTHSYDDIQPLVDELEPWLQENIPVLTRTRKYDVGVADTWKIEARISGPAEADLSVIREAGDRAMEIFNRSPYTREISTEMREPAPKLVPLYNQEQGRWANITRQDLGDSTKRAYDGLQVGLYRESDDLYPIVLRNVEPERQNLVDGLPALQIMRAASSDPVPLGQITDGVEVVWEDPLIHRWDRRRAVTVRGSPKDGETFPTVIADVRDEIDELVASLPPGYEVFWDGEEQSSLDGKQSLVPGVVPAVVLMCIIIVLLYNSILVLLSIMLVVPFAAIGVIYGLLLLDSPMGFVAILGVLSLTGMMIKNMIVMTSAIHDCIADGLHPFDACVQASVSQSRPIMLAAGTTVLGVMPLFPDPFWNAMAASIMGGLGLGAILTVILYPTVYATLHNIKEPGDEAEGAVAQLATAPAE